MSNPFTNYVAGYSMLLHSGAALSAAAAQRPLLPEVPDDAPLCLVFAPHPDDEAIMGGLPWRLRRECGWRVVNVAVTLGSDTARRDARWRELTACCDFLGFDLLSASGESRHGLERIGPRTVVEDARYWSACVARVADLIAGQQPRLIVCPHSNDGHPAHIGTHLLVMDALRQLGSHVSVHLALGEYWNTQPDPGLLVELGVPDVTALMAALSLHAGEVARNPYHLTLPAFFMDAVRRGAERVCAPGSAAPSYAFAALYGWQQWANGQCRAMPGRLLPLSASPAGCFG